MDETTFQMASSAGLSEPVPPRPVRARSMLKGRKRAEKVFLARLATTVRQSHQQVTAGSSCQKPPQLEPGAYLKYIRRRTHVNRYALGLTPTIAEEAQQLLRATAPPERS